MFAAQGVWSFILGIVDAEVPNLFPMGALLFVLLSLPCFAAAYIGKWLAGRVPA
jgi:hypothetical protein